MAVLKPRRIDYLVALSGEAATISVVQLLPMFVLGVVDFALYSSVYLGFAAVLAVKFAVISDVWAREVAGVCTTPVENQSFLAALTGLSIAGGSVVGAVAGFVVHDLLLSALSFIAVTFGVFRGGCVYRLVSDGRILRSGTIQLSAAAASAVVAGLLIAFHQYTSTTALLVWASSALIASLMTGMVPSVSSKALRHWWNTHRISITLLVEESMIKTLESVVTPFIVGGIAGAAALSLHRAGSSITYPVRVVLESMRARIINGSITPSLKTFILLTTFGATAGAAVGSALLVSAAFDLGRGSVFQLLTQHPVDLGAWVCVTALTTFYEYAARGVLSGRALINRRLAHSAIIVIGTGAAAAIWGVDGVIWGVVGTRLIALPLWVRACHREANS